jgi:hypothetical protein
VEAFTATLALDPTLLRGLRSSLAAWLDGAGASSEQGVSILLATHEATANAMADGAGGGSVNVTANRDGDSGFVVDICHDGAWEPHGSDERYVSLAALMADLPPDEHHLADAQAGLAQVFRRIDR